MGVGPLTSVFLRLRLNKQEQPKSRNNQSPGTPKVQQEREGVRLERRVEGQDDWSSGYGLCLRYEYISQISPGY